MIDWFAFYLLTAIGFVYNKKWWSGVMRCLTVQRVKYRVAHTELNLT